MQGDKIIIPASAAGFVSIFGNISKGTGDTVNLPEGMCNIGGNGYGYLLAPQSSWNPLTAGNNDGSFASLALGDDIYIYACRHSSGTAAWVASKNSTVPTGYDADTSRKMGGFHVGRYRGVENRYSTSYVPVVQILPGSCWDVGHRPTCDPSGMVEVIPGSMWADIYLNSVGSGVWPSIVPVSKYGATLIRDNTYARIDLHQIINNAGKRLPTPEEFLRYAEGAPAGLDGSNDQAWSMTTNTGPTTAGGVAKAVSQYDVVDAGGNLWEWLDSHYDLGDYNGSVTPFAWDNVVVDVGPDSAIPRGYVYRARWQAFLGGGHWYEGVRAGARCLHSNTDPWFAGGYVGLRGVCDSL
jgi:hypothetical protein